MSDYQSISDLFGTVRIVKDSGKVLSERGVLLEYFAKKMEMPIPRIAFMVGHLKELKDLYYLKSICDGYEKEGKGPWAKCFNGSLKTK